MAVHDERAVLMSLYREDALVGVRVVFCVMANAYKDMTGVLIIFRC